MLLELNIHNIALIESLRIEFARGFNVLTGETGSGKSIVVDCMALVLGGRAGRDFVRTGADRGMVQALFDISDNVRARQFVDTLGIECDDGLVAVARELSRNGRNVCRISGIIVPLNTLKRFTAMLLDIHGQHEHQSLLNPTRHVDFLDAFGDAAHAEKKATVARLYAERTALAASLKKCIIDVAEKERLIDMLRFQIDEISAAHLKHGEEEKLEARLKILENSEKIRSGIETAYALTYQGDGRALSAQELLLRAATAMEGISSINEKYAALAGRLRELYYAAQDAGYELQALLEHINHDPALLDKISERLDMIRRLERKYGPSLEDVIRFGETAAARLSQLQANDEHIDAQKKELRKLDSALKGACMALTTSRRALGEMLSDEVMTQLKDLGMAKTRFEIRLETASKPGENGVDRVEFMISPNPGEPLRPLASIASGGEISRVMLALKAIAMDADGVDSMVFDEIDTGVSGRMAQVVGEKMCRIAGSRQVLCVTHLPQIAALGNAHFLVEKHVQENRTDTNVRILDETGRIHELSRLVGGAEDSESSLSHAAHMLEEARGIREQIQRS